MRTAKLIILIMLAFLFNAEAQISLDDCQQKARMNYPLIRQFGLIEQTQSYNLSNVSKGYLPQVSVSAKVSYQSEVTEFPLQLPNIEIESLSKDQYQAVAEVSQLIWDGGVIRSYKEITRATAEVDKQKLEVDLYALNERVNQVFFGILLLDEQLKQVEMLQHELLTNSDRVSAGIKNGVANSTDLDIIKVEQLKTYQRKTEITATRKAYVEMLSALIGEPIAGDENFQKPLVQLNISKAYQINRPELQLFDSQNSLLASQTYLITSANLPKIGAYLQGGYGKPGINMLKNEFAPFYIGGVRLSWNLSGFYSQRNNLNKIEINQQTVESQRQTFLFNTNLKVNQQQNEIDKIREVIKTDNEIIALRKNIKTASEAKVENGTLTVSDLVRDINAENMALQEKALHEIQLLMAIYNLKNTTNN